MTVIPFQPKNSIEPRNAAETLAYVLDAIQTGDTIPEGMVIAWNEQHEDDRYHLRYMVGGKTTLAGTVGMLEIVKGELLK